MEDQKIIFLKEDGTPDEEAEIKQKLKETASTAAKYGGVALKEGWKFFTENKENIAAFLGIVATTATIVKQIAPSKTERRRDRVDNSVYDYHEHYRYRLRRPLTSYEAYEYNRRLKAGESSYDILKSMHVLR